MPPRAFSWSSRTLRVLLKRNATPSTVGLLKARPRSLGPQVVCVLHAAQSHADPCLSAQPCMLHGPLVGADPSQDQVTVLVLPSLAESPPFLECQPKSALLPPASSLASLPTSSARMFVTFGSHYSATWNPVFCTRRTMFSFIYGI